MVLSRSTLLLATAGRYGWHRDELYYFAAGRHPSAGYVDFPPLTPLLSAVARNIFGASLVGQRSLAVLAGAVVTVAAALVARELGGGRWAQAVAALSVGWGPVLLGVNSLFQTVSFDQVAWAVLLLVVLRLVRTGDRRWWWVVGGVAGVGLETKYTIAVLLVSLVGALAAARATRPLLRGSQVWVGAGVALVLVAPNLWWQARHGWPSIAFFTGADGQGPERLSTLSYIRDALMIAGPVGSVLGVAGLRRLFRSPGTRPLAVASIAVVVLFGLAGGKGYYPAPVTFLLVPAGAVAAERWRRGRVAVPSLTLVSALLLLPLLVPVVPTGFAVDHGIVAARTDYLDELGWPELEAAVARTFHKLPAADQRRAGIITTNYGEAGAVDLYGPADGLPGAMSDHLTYRYWHRSRPDATVAVVVSETADWVREHCTTSARAATVSNRLGVDNKEAGAGIWVCHLRTNAGKELARG